MKEAGITLDYPSTWTKVTFSKELMRKSVARMAKKNPNLAKRLDDAAQEALLKGAKFEAMDLEDESVDNVMVAAVDEDFPSVSELAEIRAAFANAGFAVLRASSPHFGRREGYRLDLTRTVNGPDGTQISLRVAELLVPNGDDTTVVAVTTQDDASGEAIIENVMASVRRV